MRATISFEAEVDRVNDVMVALAKQETDSIRSSAHVIETAQPHQIHEKINVAAETPMAMNSASDVRQVTQNMQRFDSFLGRINEESIDDVAAQEG